MQFRQPWIVSDMLNDPLFASAKKAAEVSPIRAAFSVPVIDGNNHCLGSLACHYYEPHTPAPEQILKNQLWASMIAHLISEHQRMQQSENRVATASANQERPQERWRELCRLITVERDPVRFDQLLMELDEVLSRRHAGAGASHLAQGRLPWKEIATELARVTDRRRFHKLAEQLEQALALELPNSGQGHLVESHPYLPGTSQRIEYDKIVDAAVSLLRSDFASMQMLFPERGTGGELLLLTFRGFNPQSRQILGVGARRLKKYLRHCLARYPSGGRARYRCLRLHGRFRRSAGLSSDRHSRLPNHPADRSKGECRGNALHPLAYAPSTL